MLPGKPAAHRLHPNAVCYEGDVRHSRSYIGVELVPAYIEIIKKRFARTFPEAERAQDDARERPPESTAALQTQPVLQPASEATKTAPAPPEETAAPPGAVLVGRENLERRLAGQRFVLDVETTGLHWWRDRVLGLSLTCAATDVRTYVPVPDEVALGRVRAFLAGLLHDPAAVFIGHNIKFDLHMLGLDPGDPTFVAGIEDTSVMAHLVESNQRKALEDVEEHWLHTSTKRTFLDRHRGSQKHLERWPEEEQQDYCRNDGRITAELHAVLRKTLEQYRLLPLFQQELRYLRLLWQIERRGVLLDLDTIGAQQRELHARQEALERDLYALCGEQFNWRAPHQLSDVLYNHLGLEKPKDPLPGKRHTTSKHYTSACTSSYLLTKKVQHPVGGVVLALREAAKLWETLEQWRTLADDEPALHTSYNQTGTRTGRLSSSMPNLQNVANKTRRTYAEDSGSSLSREETYLLRRGIVARPGHTLVAIDYEQQEARLFALLAGEQRMLARLRERSDLHADLAELIWHTRDPIRRRHAKDVTFALTYGMNTESLAELLATTPDNAARITGQYFGTFPRVREYMAEIQAKCARQGGVRYWDGRIWRPEYPGEGYKAVNALVQGGCAGLLRTAALRCAGWLHERGGGHLVLLVHDEIVFELENAALREAVPALMHLMELEDVLKIPFFTSAKAGPNYAELAPWIA